MASGTAPESMSEMPWIKWLDLDTAIEPDGALVVALRRPKPEHVNHDGSINVPVAYGVAALLRCVVVRRGRAPCCPAFDQIVRASSVNVCPHVGERWASTPALVAAVDVASARGRASSPGRCGRI